MTDTELLNIVELIITEEFERGIQTGLIPPDADESELQSLYEFNAELLYALIEDDPHLKSLLATAAPPEISRRVWNFLSAQYV